MEAGAVSQAGRHLATAAQSTTQSSQYKQMEQTQLTLLLPTGDHLSNTEQPSAVRVERSEIVKSSGPTSVL